MPASLALFFGLLGRGWKAGQQPPNADHRAARGPRPAGAAAGERAVGFLTGLIGIISSGLSAVSGVLVP